MKGKKIAAILLSVGMAGAALTGCSGKDTAAKTQTASDDAANDTAAAADAEAANTENTNTEDTNSGDSAASGAAEDAQAATAEEATGDAAQPWTVDRSPDFLRERTGQTSFASYDAVIDQLQEGEFYAFFGIDGYDGEILGITDAAYDAEFQGLSGTVTTDASFYAVSGDKAECIGRVSTGDSSYPLRNSDGLLYVCSEDSYGEMKVQKNDDGQYELYYVRYAGKTTENGETVYQTLDRADGPAAAEILGVDSNASFQALFTPLENIPPVSFWAYDSGFGR